MSSTTQSTVRTGYMNRDDSSERPALPTTEKKRRLPYLLNTRTLGSHLFFGPYVYLPIITGLTWLGGLLALMGLWTASGKPRYRPTQGSIVFVSHVAGVHRTLFICITSVVAVFWWATLIAERWLRHKNRLPADVRPRERTLGYCAIGTAFVGGLGLILLAVFDCYDYSPVHWSMAFTFIFFTAVSASCQSGEVWSLYKDHPERLSLLRSSFFKLIVVFSAVLGAIAFAVLYIVCRGKRLARGSLSANQCNNVTSGAAAMEWTCAFILVFYFLSLAGDLWGSGKSSPRYHRRLAQWEAKQRGSTHWESRAKELHEKTIGRNRDAVIV
ncbi:hypothetical protein CspeluHIS016_0107890 [Cutaneotrichosporon spelunceum]|uniref:CWH43-like N-terminal domain-containing protein n=1 Tax=Cutaneotrichosporon spelunceum TaxID=1672016 RepID=A0AAD3Y9P4_9TREE|nr:hypothetical protein CspeluHIS016_0107890 [Cutaneotrichosporon spelunceum]